MVTVFPTFFPLQITVMSSVLYRYKLHMFGDITLPSSYSVDSLAVYNTIVSIDFYDSAGYVQSDTSTAGYLPKVQSNFEDIPLDFTAMAIKNY